VGYGSVSAVQKCQAPAEDRLCPGQGESIESDNYTIRSGYADVIVGDQQRRISLSELDMKTTLAVNHKRGVDLKIPTGNNEVFLAF
jgi:hypothetical protein